MTRLWMAAVYPISRLVPAYDLMKTGKIRYLGAVFRNHCPVITDIKRIDERRIRFRHKCRRTRAGGSEQRLLRNSDRKTVAGFGA